MSMHAFIPENTLGRDFVVGDIHGYYAALMSEMKLVGFDREKDRLFSLGDIIDRGPESAACLNLLNEDWFFMVRGNHEQMMVEALRGKRWPRWRRNYGGWTLEMKKSTLKSWAKRLSKTPIALTLDQGDFSVGLCHAEPDGRNWTQMRDNPGSAKPMMWGRRVLHTGKTKPVKGVDITIHGHTPLNRPRWMGNRYFMDTGAGHGGPLTLRNIADIHAEYLKFKALKATGSKS